MNTFAIILVCFQLCLVQNVLSQCTSRAAVSADPYGLGTTYGYDGLAGWGGAPYNYRGGYADVGYSGAPFLAAEVPYGGVGEGNVAVAGELPVSGSTVVAGQVPITGAVRFGGEIPAAGAVTISGKCACGCGSPYEYLY